MRIFITGATGFLGNELFKELHARNHDLTALVRTSQQATSFPATTKIVKGNVENVESYRASLKGQDVFVHLAALVRMWVRDRKTFDLINVQATEAAMKASTDSGIPKFVYASSFIALGPSNGAPLQEKDERRTHRFNNDYERTKFLADRKAREYIEQGHPVYILYPGVIYGPGNLTEGNIVVKNIVLFLRGKVPFGLAIKTWSYAYIQDVIRGFISVIEGNPQSRRYILGGDNQPVEAFYQKLYEVTGKKPPRINLPLSIAAAAGYGEYILAQLFGRNPSLLTHEVARIYAHSWSFDSSRAKHELDYRITPLKEGLIQVVTWLRNCGQIP